VPRHRPVLSALGTRIVGGVMLALYVAAVQVEPPPDGPQPVLPGWATVLVTVNVVTLYAAAAGFARGRRWGLRTGLAFGATTLTSVVLCPVLGHHQIAGWWFGQLAIGAAMVLLPAAVLAGTRDQPGRSSSS